NFVVPARLICEIALARVGLLGLQRLHATARRQNFPTLSQQRFLVWGQIHAVVSVLRFRQKIILARYLSPPMRSPRPPSMPPMSRLHPRDLLCTRHGSDPPGAKTAVSGATRDLVQSPLGEGDADVDIAEGAEECVLLAEQLL